MSNGTIDLGQLLRQATTDDKDAVTKLFKGFLAEGETISECGYLGSLGLIFPERDSPVPSVAIHCGMDGRV